MEGERISRRELLKRAFEPFSRAIESFEMGESGGLGPSIEGMPPLGEARKITRRDFLAALAGAGALNYLYRNLDFKKTSFLEMIFYLGNLPVVLYAGLAQLTKRKGQEPEGKILWRAEANVPEMETPLLLVGVEHTGNYAYHVLNYLRRVEERWGKPLVVMELLPELRELLEEWGYDYRIFEPGHLKFLGLSGLIPLAALPISMILGEKGDKGIVGILTKRAFSDFASILLADHCLGYPDLLITARNYLAYLAIRETMKRANEEKRPLVAVFGAKHKGIQLLLEDPVFRRMVELMYPWVKALRREARE